ncbi:hypothetical protein CHU98_g10657 [Xylaria longipes]|nr:hypothetical protein CHU98_g10657 [Xylaria longipes]
MPPFSRPFNGPPTAGVIAVSFAVAAAIAIYESEELQRITEDLRRRIAIALHAFGDSITPQERENLFNRPEDAEGFLQSRGLGPGSVPGVDADAESLRRQREELMYWNAVRESKKEQDKTHRPRGSTSSSFDDFLEKDENAEQGTFIYHTGHEPANNEGLVRRRGTDGLRGLNYSMVTDPFADEHGIESDIAFENSLMEPAGDEMSDIYSATDVGAYHSSRTMSPQHEAPAFAPTPAPAFPALVDDKEDEGEEDATRNDAYSSIQAWAQNSASHGGGFYSPLPASPAPASEAGTDADFVTDGELTPTDSASLAGSGVDVADEVTSSRSFDVLSRSSGMNTPTSWTDVESQAAESEGGVHA